MKKILLSGEGTLPAAPSALPSLRLPDVTG